MAWLAAGVNSNDADKQKRKFFSHVRTPALGADMIFSFGRVPALGIDIVFLLGRVPVWVKNYAEYPRGLKSIHVG